VDTPQTHWVRSYVGAPIFVEGKVIGFINLDSASPGYFTSFHGRRLQAFTDQAAVAIQNARLYQKLEAYSENLEATVEARTAELRYFTERVETILNSSSDAILLVGVDGAIRQVNPATCDLFGYQNAEIFGRLPSLLFLPTHREAYDSTFRSVISQGQANRLEITARRQNGTTFDADVALAPVKEGDVITGIVCSVRDISALKEIERLKDAFVSNVSHELRTPITNLKLYQHLLAARNGSPVAHHQRSADPLASRSGPHRAESQPGRSQPAGPPVCGRSQAAGRSARAGSHPDRAAGPVRHPGG
jgi:PAS domain S-box-containing protein